MYFGNYFHYIVCWDVFSLVFTAKNMKETKMLAPMSSVLYLFISSKRQIAILLKMGQ